MSVKIEMNPELEAKAESVIQDLKAKQDEGKIELYNDEMNDMISKHGELALLAAGCQIVKSSWKNYLILPEEYIEDKFIPRIKVNIVRVLTKNTAE